MLQKHNKNVPHKIKWCIIRHTTDSLLAFIHMETTVCLMGIHILVCN